MCKRCSPYQIPPSPLSPSHTLAPLSIWGSLWRNSIGKSTKIFTPHTRAPQLILHAAQRSVQLPHPPRPSPLLPRTVPAELSDVHVSAFYWACTTTMWGAYVQPAGVKTLCTHIDCLTEFYLCCWSVPARSAARFGSVYYNCFLCELVFVGHKVHIKLHASKSQIKEKPARNRKHAQVARGQQWVKRQTGPMPVGARRVNNRLSS